MCRVTALGRIGVPVLVLTSCMHSGPSIEAGRDLYDFNGCASCHGRTGHGDGPAAATLPSKPADFRNPAQFHKGYTEDAIAKTLEDGISIVHSMPVLKTTHHMLLMPKFDHLSDSERRSLALYVLSMRGGTGEGRSQP